MRAPHPPRNEIKSVWSLGLSWDAKTQFTTGVFDGASDFDLDLLLSNLRALPADHLGHPLLIPHLLLQQLVVYYNRHWTKFGQDLFHIERKFGLTNGHKRKNPWSWGQAEFRNITQSLSDVNTGLIYAERRLNFANSLAKYLIENVIRVESQTDTSNDTAKISECIQEELQNTNPFLENQLHQVSCLQKRSQLLTNSVSISNESNLSVQAGNNITDFSMQVYTIIAQIDNTTNIRIGMAAKHDSTSMMTIAFVTILFLPATFVSVSRVCSPFAP